MTTALNKQEGGNHYKDMKIQPVEFITANKIPFIEGSVIKYVSRWRNKNGIQDLKKAIHFLELLIELENKECNLKNINTAQSKQQYTQEQDQVATKNLHTSDWDSCQKLEKLPVKLKNCCETERLTPVPWSEKLEMSAGMLPDSVTL